MVTALLVASLLCADDLEHVADEERPSACMPASTSA